MIAVELDTTWLETFLVAAQEEHFGRAADRLHLAQPTVSLHVAKLESRLGVPLFVRTGRAVRLSSYGRRFLRYAETALQSLEDGARSLELERQGRELELKVAVSPLIAATALPGWVRAFGREASHVAVTVMVDESINIAARVAVGAADVGLSRLPADRAELRSLRLGKDPVVLAAPQDAYDLDGPPRSLGDLLADYPLLTDNHPQYWDDTVRTVRRLWPSARMVSVSQVAVTLAWVEEGMGISFLPWTAVRRALLLGTVVEVPCPEVAVPDTASYLIWDEAAASEGARLFAAFLTRYVTMR